MDISRVKYTLGKLVRLRLPRHYVDGEYMLTGCMIRKNKKNEYFYQAELTDTNSKSVIIAKLDDIEEIRNQTGSPAVGEQQ